MKRTFFENIKTLDELKKQYKKLCKQYHPDNGGDAETMKAVNAEYDTIFPRVKNIRETADGRTYTAETHETPEQFRDIINHIITLDNIVIEIIGVWVWVTGNTYAAKDTLKNAGFKWAHGKKAWYWHSPETGGKTSKKKLSLDDIRAFYGSETVQGVSIPKLGTA